MIKRSCALLLALFYGVASAGQLTDQVDRFEQKRELKWVSSIRGGDSAQMGTNASVVFSKDNVALNGIVQLAASFESLRYSRCNSARWLVDGTPMVPLSTEYQAYPRKDSSRSVEIVTSIFTAPQLREIGRANLVEYKVCNDEGKVAEEDLAGLRELTDRL